MTKYKEYYQKMVEENAELFESFREIHDLYAKNKFAHQDEFNEIGYEVIEVIRDWERRLCSAMGRGKYSSYSHRLADKFKEEIRKTLPLIDVIGVKIKKPAKN